MLLKMAWKNIWRNKRRTVIVSGSVFFAVILACIMRSAQLGSYSYMIDSSAKMQTGYLQIHGTDFWEKRSLDESFILDPQLMQEWANIEGVESLTPRIEAFALLSRDTITKVAPVIGIEPFIEQKMTQLQNKLSTGRYLQNGDKGILLAEGLAKRLKAQIGDSVILYGSGYHGQMAAANLEIIGIVKLPLPLMNNIFSYIELENARQIYATPQMVTSVSVMIDHINNIEAVKKELDATISDKMRIMTWDEMLPELVQSIQLDNVGGMIMITILYIVIGFGVFGTIMMMTAEREKEFGILYSVGMKKQIMMGISFLETLFISFLGVVAGVLSSLPIVTYLGDNPIRLSGEEAATFENLGIEAIMAFSTEPTIYLTQSVIVFAIAAICATYPLVFLTRLDPLKAMRK